jgi:hypothetical protein
VQVIEEHQERFDADPVMKAQWLAIAGVARARVGDAPGARRFFLQAWRTRPTELQHLRRYAITWVPSLSRQRWAAPSTRS